MRTKIVLSLLLIGIVALAVFFKFYAEKQAGFGAFRDCNVVLITIDTLRADHLPVYGYTQVKTPNLDRLANESLIFEDAIAHIPMTLPSHVSILTGLLPAFHGVRDNAGFSLDSKITTLAETLKSNGYTTAAFVSAFVLDAQFGLNQGFDLYSDDFTLTQARVASTDVYRRAEETEVEVEAWLKQNKDRRFFLWVHYYDPHDPYDPPEPFKSEYAASLYDGEIAYTDHVLGNLMASLTQSGALQNTVIVMTGDHGEGLGEHKERTHSLFVYNATQHIPLLIRLPKAMHRRIAGVVGHMDIVPTILDWLGIHPDTQMQGKSLIPLIQGTEDSNRTAYSESMFPELHYGWSPLMAITTSQYKFIDAPRAELYDRKSDSAELKNLMSEKPEIAKELRKQLDEIIRLFPRQQAIAPQNVDPETEEKLRALGYTGTVVPGTPESRKVDPKDRIELLEALSMASSAMEAKNYPNALQAANRVLQQDQNIVDAHFLAASAYLHLGEKEKALAEMMRTIRLKPNHTQTLYNLGFFYQLQGNPEEAEHWYLQLLKYEPSNLFGNLNLAGLYLKNKQPLKAQPYLSRVENLYQNAFRTATAPKTRSSLLEKLAEIEFKTGEIDRSEQHLKEAIQLTPDRAMLHFHLGDIYEARGQSDAARTEYMEEIKVAPKNYQAFFKLGLLYGRTGRLQDAIDCFRKAIEIDQQFYPAYYALAEAYLSGNTNLEEALRLTETATRSLPSKQGDLLLQAIRKRLQGR